MFQHKAQKLYSTSTSSSKSKNTIKSNSTILDPNQLLTLDAIVLPVNAANKAITWTSSSTTYATVAATSATAASVTGVRERREREGVEREPALLCLFFSFEMLRRRT